MSRPGVSVVTQPLMLSPAPDKNSAIRNPTSITGMPKKYAGFSSRNCRCTRSTTYCWAPHPGHFGLVGLAEQAQLIGADLHIDSAPDRGTTLSVTLRLAPEAL